MLARASTDRRGSGDIRVARGVVPVHHGTVRKAKKSSTAEAGAAPQIRLRRCRMHPRHTATALILLLAIPSALAEDAPSVARELPVLEEAAAKGDAAAQLALGLAYDRFGADKQRPIEERRAAREKARDWIRKAADQNLAEAVFWLAYGGFGAARSEPTNYARAAELGYVPAFPHALDALLFRAGAAANVAAAKHVVDLARAKGVTQVTNDLLETVDQCYAAGEPVIPEEDRAKLDGDEDNVHRAERYANGEGVTRNLRLAISLVCHGSDVPMELVGMVETLVRMQAGIEPGKPFRFCNHVTSALNGQGCLREWEVDTEESRSQALAPLRARLDESQRAALDALLAAADAFIRLDVKATSPEPGGTPHYLDAPARQQMVRADELVRVLLALGKGPLPADRDFARADRELNATWSELMKRADVFRPAGYVDRDALREAQRSWVSYRDAWAWFAKKLYPKTSGLAWKAWVTRARISELRDF